MKLDLPIFKGQWQDTYHYVDGTTEVKPWTDNQIQDTYATFVTMLIKETVIGQPNVYGGVQYLALGTGLVGWDTVAPTQARTDTTLTTETHRISIVGSSITYVDPTTFVVSATPTRAQQFSVIIPNAIVGDLREFALFGGDATATLDSGRMMSWVVHGKIEKTTLFSITRTYRLIALTYDECVAL